MFLRRCVKLIREISFCDEIRRVMGILLTSESGGQMLGACRRLCPVDILR